MKLTESKLRRLIKEEKQHLTESYESVKAIIDKLRTTNDPRSSSGAGLKWTRLTNRLTSAVKATAQSQRDIKKTIDLIKNNTDVQGVSENLVDTLETTLQTNKQLRLFKNAAETYPQFKVFRADATRVGIMHGSRGDRRYFVYNVSGGSLQEKANKPNSNPMNYAKTIRTFDIRTSNPESVLKYLQQVVQ